MVGKTARHMQQQDMARREGFRPQVTAPGTVLVACLQDPMARAKAQPTVTPKPD